jgi:hypothetical protein
MSKTIEEVTGKTREEVKAMSEAITAKYSEYGLIFEDTLESLKALREHGGESLQKLQGLRDTLNILTDEDGHFSLLISIFNSCGLKCRELENLFTGIQDFIVHLEVIRGVITGKSGISLRS